MIKLWWFLSRIPFLDVETAFSPSSMFAPWRSQSSLHITWVSHNWQIIHWVEDDSNPFDLLLDELPEIIIAESLSGLKRGLFVRVFTRLHNRVWDCAILLCHTSAHFHDYTSTQEHCTILKNGTNKLMLDFIPTILCPLISSHFFNRSRKTLGNRLTHIWKRNYHFLHLHTAAKESSNFQRAASEAWCTSCT